MAIGSRAASRRLNPAAHTIAVVGFMAMLGASLITLIDVFMRWRFNLDSAVGIPGTEPPRAHTLATSPRRLGRTRPLGTERSHNGLQCS